MTQTATIETNPLIQDIENQVKKTKPPVEVTRPTIEEPLDPRYLAHSKLLCYCALQYPKYQVALHHKLIADHLEAVERGEISRLIITTPPRHGKPNDVNSLCLMEDGLFKRLGDIKTDDKIITHINNGAKPVLKVYEQGKLECIKIKTYLGHEIIGTKDHPVLTTEGWMPLGDLTTEYSIAVLHGQNIIPSATESDEEFRFAGYMIGDGTTSFNISFANGDDAILNDFEKCCKILGFPIRRKFVKKNHSEFFPLQAKPWLRQYKLYGKLSRQKTVPNFVFRGTKRQISLFIAAYFDCDGTVNKRSKKRTDCCAEFYSVNYALLKQVQHLLLRLDIKSRLRSKKGRYKDQPHESWRLAITSLDDISEFRRNIPIIGNKKKHLDEWSPVRLNFMNKLFPDRIASIQNVGLRECRCLEIADDHSFTIDDIVTHNTMLVSQFFPAWYLGRHPKNQVIAATYSGEKAGDVGREVRNQMIDPLHQQIFPRCQISKDSASVKKFSTTKYGNYFSVGLGGAIVGRGANLFLIDDPVKGRENAESETRRRQMKQWYEGVAYTRLMPEPNAIVIILTRWHSDDLAGWLLREHTHENWVSLKLPALSDSLNDPLGRETGEALWPDWFDEKYLLNVKQTVGTREWSAQYQQVPILAEGGIINIDWFKRYKIIDGQIAFQDADGNIQFEKIKRTVQSWDTAYKANELNDPSVCTTWKVTRRGYFLWDVFAKRMEYPELKKQMGRQHTMHNPNAILVEDKSSGQSLIQEFRMTDMPIISVNPIADKVTRMATESDTIEAGKVFLPEQAPWLVDYESELGTFPYGQFDDQVDSTSQFLQWIKRKGLYKKRNLQFWK